MERNRIVFRMFYGLMALIFLALGQAAKEAFTQVNGGDNSLTEHIVPFPATGGVVL